MLIGPMLQSPITGEGLVEPPGIAPGSSPLITSAFIAIVRASPDPTNIGRQGYRRKNPRQLSSAVKFLGHFGHEAALEAGAFEFDGAGLALALTAGDGGGAIGRATDDFVQGHLALEAVGQADDDQAEVQQVGDDGEEGLFLTAVLGGDGGEGGADFADQRA